MGTGARANGDGDANGHGAWGCRWGEGDGDGGANGDAAGKANEVREADRDAHSEAGVDGGGYGASNGSWAATPRRLLISRSGRHTGRVPAPRMHRVHTVHAPCPHQGLIPGPMVSP